MSYKTKYDLLCWIIIHWCQRVDTLTVIGHKQDIYEVYDVLYNLIRSRLFDVLYGSSSDEGVYRFFLVNFLPHFEL